tara:strand:- start:1735 stop:2034 length:300 start_codon:yes stop_codon:yes gene_type:complete
MLYQLPNGRVIEMSLEQYLSMSEQDLRDLNGLGNEYSSDITNPFHKSSLKDSIKGKIEKSTDIDKGDDGSDYIQEREPDLDEISDADKLSDGYFHPDDI